MSSNAFKNFFFRGNNEATENTAIICSLLAICKVQGVNPEKWLNGITARLPYYLEKGFGKTLPINFILVEKKSLLFL